MRTLIAIPWPILWPPCLNSMDYHWEIHFQAGEGPVRQLEPTITEFVPARPSEEHLREAVRSARERLARISATPK